MSATKRVNNMSKVCLIATLLLLAACSTPQPARDLAAQGADRKSVV